MAARSRIRIPIVVAACLAAAVAVVFLLLGNPFAPSGGPVDDRFSADAEPGLPLEGGAAGTEDEATARPTLARALDPTGTGAVRVRLLLYEDRTPIVGQTVRLADATGARLEQPTAEDGTVQFQRLPSGTGYVLSVEPAAGAEFSAVTVRGIEVKAKQVTALDDLLLGVQVVLRGKVIDGKGAPIPGASVAAYTGGTADLSQGIIGAMVLEALRFPSPVEETKTDPEGLFALASLTPGTYRLTTKRAGYALNLQPDLVVVPERVAGAITIVLGPSATLRGRVTDDAGKPVAKAMVMAIDDPGSRPGPQATSLRKDYTIADADGKYVLDTLNRGTTYRFAVSATGWAPIFDGQGVLVENDLERDFVLVLGGAIEGTVADAATGKPVKDARVLALVGRMGPGMGRGGRGRGTPAAPAEESYASTATGITDAAGFYRLEGLRPGPVAISQVSAVGYVSVLASQMMGSSWGEVKAGETLKMAVELEPGGSVTGRVTSASDGKPVVGATVAVADQMSMWSGYPTSTTDSDGVYKVDGVRAPSTFSVIPSAPGFAPPDPFAEGSQAKMPEGGGTVTKDVVLTSAGAVEGTVKNSRGDAVAGARVRAKVAPSPRGGGGLPFGRGGWRAFLPGSGSVTLSDAEGRFRIENLASEEKWVVEAEDDANVPSESAPFDVRPGDTRRMDVVLLGAGAIKGRVIDDRGATVSGARVRVGHLDSDTASAPNLSGWRADSLLDQRLFTSDDQGWFEVTKVRPGQTLLRVEREGYVTSYRRDLVVPADAALENHVVTLVKGVTISGLVKGDDGRPVAGAMVAVTKSANPGRFGAPPPSEGAAPEANVEPSMSDRTDAQGRFTVENVPPDASYSVLIWGAPGYVGFGQGDESAIKRGVAAGSRDVEFTLKKQQASSGFPGAPPRPPPAPPPTAPMSR